MSGGDALRILLVEDEPDLQAVIRLVLESVPGWSLRVCGGGAEALEVVEQDQFDLVLLDVMMPGMDGPETLRNLRRAGHHELHVVFLTARRSAVEINRYRELGAIGVIAKPFDPLELPRTVQEIWEQRSEGRSDDESTRQL